MEVSRKSRRILRLQTLSFVVLFLAVVGLLAWLSTRYNYQADWTASGRHTLSTATGMMLEKLDGPVTITSFSREDDLNAIRKRTTELVSRYQQIKPDIKLDFIDPDLAPDKVRELGVSLEGELVVEFAGRRENLKTIGEQALTNTLQRLARAGERKIMFLQGHGERHPTGEANHDLKDWADQLKAQGFSIETLNLGLMPTIPQETSVLVIPGPRTPLLPGEVKLILDYVKRGGNLLWLSDPADTMFGLEPLANSLGINFIPGTLVDATGQLLGIEHPAFIIVAEYPAHPVTEELNTLTLFPKAHGIVSGQNAQWQPLRLLHSLERAWSETGKLEGNIRFNEEQDFPGPLTIGVLLTRDRETGDAEPRHEHHLGKPPQAMQRIAVIGDGDFLANAYLGNGANQELGNRLINWLSHDDIFITIPPRTAPDTRLEMTKTTSAIIGFGFLIILPLGLLAMGVIIWLKRRKR